MDLTADLRRIVADSTSRWIDLRRDIHRRPELGWLEFITTDRIARALEDLGLEPTIGRSLHAAGARLGVPPDAAVAAAFASARAAGVDPTRLDRMAGGYTGVLCRVRGERPGPTRMLRCDIDALPIAESDAADHPPQRDGHSSRQPGIMHACGHDAHAAIAVGCAEILTRLRDHLHGDVLVVFQPAEEGVRGAASMVDAGLADGVEEFLGFHIGVGATAHGELVCGWNGLLATTKWDVQVHGRSAHAGIAPERGADALLTAAQAALSLMAAPARLPPGCRVHVGTLRAGEARNAVAAHAELRLEARARSDADLVAVENLVETILHATAAVYGTQIRCEAVGRAAAADSDPEIAGRVQRAADAMSGWTTVHRTRDDYQASDDAATWIQRVRARGGRAAFIGLGTPIGDGHHNPGFDIAEPVIPAGAELLARFFLLDETT